MNVALILGAGAPLWGDIERLETLIGEPWPGIVIAVNSVGIGPDKNGRVWDRPVDHWITLHAERSKMGKWVEERRANGLPDAGCVWGYGGSSQEPGWIDRWASKENLNLHGGSSGLLACHIVLNDLGIPKGVLCGVPMDDQVNLWSGRHWGSHARYRHSWTKNAPFLKRHFRSMSPDADGNDSFTRALLGEPTAEWLNEAMEAAA